jgi:hypothetical protein
MVDCGAMNRLRAWVRRDPPLAAALGALWVCALVPIWAVRWLPVRGMAEQLAGAALWHRLADPAWSLSRFYEARAAEAGSVGYWFSVHVLSYAMPIEVANRVFLSLYAAVLLVGAAVLARRVGRSARLALFAGPLVFAYGFSIGLIGFCAGVAALLWALVTLDAFLAAPSRARAAAVVACAAAVAFFSAPAFWLFAAATLPWIACHGWRPRRQAVAAALVVPGLVIARVLPHSAAAGERPETALAALQALPTTLVTAWAGDGAYELVVLLGALWLLVLVGARARSTTIEPAPPGWPYRLELVTALAAVASYVAGAAFTPVLALFALLLPHGPVSGRRSLLLFPVVALAALYPIQLARAWHRYDARVADVRRLIHEIPRGASVLTLVRAADLGDAALDKRAAPLASVHAYAQLHAGGYDPWAAALPARVRDGAALPAPDPAHPETFRFDEHGAAYYYVLTRGETAPFALFGPNVGRAASLVDEAGAWRLYRVNRS